MIGRQPRILNVNDRETPRYVNQQMLEHEGFVVLSVANGHQALERVRDNIDLVLLDISIPDLDGYEICRRIKDTPETANIAVLLSSATFVTSSNKVTGLDSGADGYLVQPFEQPELIATIRALLRTRAAERRASALAHELRHSMDVRDEFLAMLGHELRNPIGAITTALHLLGEQRDERALGRYIPILDRQTRSLTRMVDDLLDVARVTRGKISLVSAVVDLRETVDRCRDSIGAELLGTRHQVGIEISGPAMLVEGDPVRLEQIVTNLVTNAVKYTPNGGHVTITVSRDAGSAVLVVRDTGIGMDTATVGRVFDMFAQGKQGLDRSRGGLGLGLTVVRRLVELHGGTIEAHSDGVGQGSMFTVRLPLARAGKTLTPPEQPAIPTTHDLCVLIVEDNVDARESLAELLRPTCKDVLTAADGHSGIAVALETRPDIMLVDIGLPIVDGYEVARRVRTSSGTAGPTLIAMTGYGQPEDRRQALAAGFDAHLVKPIAPADLFAQIAALRITARS